jgi:hypothetical protein
LLVALAVRAVLIWAKRKYPAVHHDVPRPVVQRILVAAVLPLLAVGTALYTFVLLTSMTSGPLRVDIVAIVLYATLWACFSIPVLLASMFAGQFSTGFIEEIERQFGVSIECFWIFGAAGFAAPLAIALFMGLTS